MTFAIGTEADALLYQACAAAAADGQQGQQQCCDVLQSARQQLHTLLLDHFAPLEAAAMQIAQEYPRHASHTTANTTSDADSAAAAAAQTDYTARPAAANGTGTGSNASSSFTYLGLDSSLAPGLDTPPLTDSYTLLLQQLNPAGGTAQHTSAHVMSHQGGSQGAREGHTVTRFGGPGSLTVSSMVTQVLKGLPLKLTGYCGLMLAVCEDLVRGWGRGVVGLWGCGAWVVGCVVWGVRHSCPYHCHDSYCNDYDRMTWLLPLLLLL
jgi:hypothetical protein